MIIDKYPCIALNIYIFLNISFQGYILKIVTRAQEIVQDESKETAKKKVWITYSYVLNVHLISINAYIVTLITS